MYRKLIFVLFVAVIGTSCLKNNNNNNNSCPYKPTTINISASERAAIDAYIDTNNIEATQDRSGFYYQIITPGTGTDSVTLCSQVQISYKGQLINDSTFDQQNNAVFVLGALIEGWRRGIPKLKKGGEIKLYIPPTLGYGSTDITDQSGKVVIPKNSILKFDVKLTDYTAGN
ncbi:MAG: FKBP-type peptidyl-prolyl cis-trans isomerase [Chitinophagaceae bacterium]|nr:FKBP-type peptidyl-prolyl cis-trans isomerase [Chitinophagaceae bacterium]